MAAVARLAANLSRQSCGFLKEKLFCLLALGSWLLQLGFCLAESRDIASRAGFCNYYELCWWRRPAKRKHRPRADCCKQLCCPNWLPLWRRRSAESLTGLQLPVATGTRDHRLASWLQRLSLAGPIGRSIMLAERAPDHQKQEPADRNRTRNREAG